MGAKKKNANWLLITRWPQRRVRTPRPPKVFISAPAAGSRYFFLPITSRFRAHPAAHNVLHRQSAWHFCNRGARFGGRPRAGRLRHHLPIQIGAGRSAPYIVAGRYLSRAPAKNSGDAVFWTTQPLPANAAATQQRFATAWSVLQKNFGQLNKRTSAPFIVESPAISFETADPASGNFRSFPGGVLVTPAALVSSTGSRDPIERSERALARTWRRCAVSGADRDGRSG